MKKRKKEVFVIEILAVLLGIGWLICIGMREQIDEAGGETEPVETAADAGVFCHWQE